MQDPAAVPLPLKDDSLSDPCRVLVLHAQASVGEALARRLAREPGFEVVSSVVRPLRALVLVPVDAIGTVVLDWDLPGGAAAPVAGQLRALDRPPRLVVLGQDDDPSAVVEALRSGARAWVPTSSPVEVLLEALRHTARGETWLPGRLLGRVLDQVVSPHEGVSTSPLDVLTERERDVLRCMVAGLGQADIASRLYLSPNTVRTHRRRTLAKLGVHSSLEAVFVARRAGLTTVGLP